MNLGAILLPLLVNQTHALLTERGSGKEWTTFYAEGRDGTGPPNVTFQLAVPRDGGGGYRISIFEDEPQRYLVFVRDFTDKVRFNQLELHRNPVNDYWVERGVVHKQFPVLLFVGNGVKGGKPVTYVWRLASEEGRQPEEILKVFNGDARWLDGHNHGGHRRHSVLIERARASWIPRAQWPKGARESSRLERKWHYEAGFTPESWRVALRG